MELNKDELVDLIKTIINELQSKPIMDRRFEQGQRYIFLSKNGIFYGRVAQELDFAVKLDNAYLVKVNDYEGFDDFYKRLGEHEYLPVNEVNLSTPSVMLVMRYDKEIDQAKVVEIMEA